MAYYFKIGSGSNIYFGEIGSTGVSTDDSTDFLDYFFIKEAPPVLWDFIIEATLPSFFLGVTPPLTY
jgi:hypothetical protein